MGTAPLPHRAGSHRSVVDFLLRSRLVSPAAIVAGAFEVVDASERNLNFKVVSAAGPSYLVKQALDAERIESLTREASIYRSLVARDDAGFERYLPRVFVHDRRRHVLVMELLRNARDFREGLSTRVDATSAHAAGLGSALARLHRLPLEAAGGLDAASVWSLTIDLPDIAVLRTVSRANVKVLGIVQQSVALRALLDRRRRDTRMDAVIHGDLRWGNCIVCRPRPGGAVQLKLVDWELAGIGDSAWDLGCVLAEFMSYWLLMFPTLTPASLSDIPASAKTSLRTMQRSIGAFLRSYCRAMRSHRSIDALLPAAVEWSAVRLLQVAYERSQSTAEPSAYAICLLQSAANIGSRPELALRTLYGFTGTA